MLTESFCDHITPNIWPPNLPDWNPLDYYVWGEVEGETNKTLSNTLDKLKARTTAAIFNLNKETVGNACRKFRNRQEAVEEVNGDVFE